MKKTIIILLVVFAVIVLIQDFLNHKSRVESANIKYPYTVVMYFDGSDIGNSFISDSLLTTGVSCSDLRYDTSGVVVVSQYSVVTGLHPNNSGVVADSFYAPGLKKSFNFSTYDFTGVKKLYKGEPVWVTAEAQGVKSAVCGIVGAESEIKGYRPSYSINYNTTINAIDRIDTAVYWLQKSYKNRPHLLIVGFNNDSLGVLKSESTDNYISYFMQKVNSLSVHDSINYIIISGGSGIGHFFATGNMFGKEKTVGSMHSVDIYNIICYTLGIMPAPNDGNKNVLPSLIGFNPLLSK